MKDNETRRNEMFLRVREHGERRAEELPAGTRAAELFTELKQVTVDLEDRANAQVAGRRTALESSTLKSVARDELMLDIEALSRTARSLALTKPGLEDKFRAPRNLKDQELLTLARTYASEAASYQADFIGLGLNPDFLRDLSADITAFEAAIERKDKGTEAHVAATAAIDELVERGMKIVRQLDTIMRNIYANSPPNLAAWLSASHVERAPRSTTPPPASPAPAQ